MTSLKMNNFTLTLDSMLSGKNKRIAKRVMHLIHSITSSGNWLDGPVLVQCLIVFMSSVSLKLCLAVAIGFVGHLWWPWIAIACMIVM